jgi:hypothetical protein
MKLLGYLIAAVLILLVCTFFGIVLLPLLATFGIIWALGALLCRWIHRKP